MTGWPVRWEASWIWWDAADRTGPDGRAADQIGCIRRRFELTDVPDAAPARICVNGRYVLHVNGERIGGGPVRSEPQCLAYDEYDLAPLLRPGTNVVAAWCRHYGDAVAFWRPTKPMGGVGRGWLAFESDVHDADGNRLASGPDWRATADGREAAEPGMHGQPPTEVVHGDRVPVGWRDAAFDDAAWPAATVLQWEGMGPPTDRPPADPHPALHARDIAQLQVVRIPAVRGVGAGTTDSPITDSPVRDFERSSLIARRAIDAGALDAGGFVTMDMGREVFGRPEVTFEAAPGAVVDLAAGEDVDGDGRPVVLPRNWAMRYHAAGARREQAEAFDPVGLRYLSVRTSEPMQLLAVVVHEELYPRPEGAWFRSSDTDLNALWEAGARTVDLCSMDAFVDCPGREQRAWLGDMYVHQMVSLVSNPDTALVRHNLRLHAQSRRPDGLLEMFAGGDIGTYPYVIPDYSLHWIRAVARVWEHLGDDSLVDELVPLMSGIADWFERFRGADGVLTDVPSWVFIDWAQTERSRQTAALDALYALAMDDLAVLHGARGDERSAARARQRADATRAAFARCYWDDDRAVFVDAAHAGAGRGRRVSQHTNSLAVLAGLTPDGMQQSVMRAVLDPERVRITKTPADSLDESVRGAYQWRAPDDFDEAAHVVGAQPYFSHFVHQAVARAGLAELIPDLVRRWLPHLADGHGCFGEFWAAAPGASSRCHGWSATPTFDLSRHVAGVAPTSAGGATVSVRPALGELSWLDASVPVPQGFVRVEARREGGAVRGRVELPADVTADVALDDGWAGTVTGPGQFAVGHAQC